MEERIEESRISLCDEEEFWWTVRDLNLIANIRDRSCQNRSQCLPFLKNHIDSSEFVGVADISGFAYR